MFLRNYIALRMQLKARQLNRFASLDQTMIEDSYYRLLGRLGIEQGSPR